MDPTQFYDTPWPMMVTILALNASTHFLKWAIGKGMPFTTTGAWKKWFPRGILLLQSVALALVGWFPGESVWTALPDALGAFAGGLAAFHIPKAGGMPTGRPNVLLAAFCLIWLGGCAGSVQMISSPVLDVANISVDYNETEGVVLNFNTAARAATNYGDIAASLAGHVAFAVSDATASGYQSLMVGFSMYIAVGVAFSFDTREGVGEFCVNLVLMESKTPYVTCWPLTFGDNPKGRRDKL